LVKIKSGGIWGDSNIKCGAPLEKIKKMYELIKAIVENPNTKENPAMVSALAELISTCPKYYFELVNEADRATENLKSNGTLQQVLGQD